MNERKNRVGWNKEQKRKKSPAVLSEGKGGGACNGY